MASGRILLLMFFGLGWFPGHSLAATQVFAGDVVMENNGKQTHCQVTMALFRGSFAGLLAQVSVDVSLRCPGAKGSTWFTGHSHSFRLHGDSLECIDCLGALSSGALSPSRLWYKWFPRPSDRGCDRWPREEAIDFVSPQKILWEYREVRRRSCDPLSPIKKFLKIGGHLHEQAAF